MARARAHKLNFQATRAWRGAPAPGPTMCACPSSACEHARHSPRSPTPVSAPLRPLCLQPSISLSLALFSTRSALTPGLPCALALLQQLNSPRPPAGSWGNRDNICDRPLEGSTKFQHLLDLLKFLHNADLLGGSPIYFELIVGLVAHVGGARPTQLLI